MNTKMTHAARAELADALRRRYRSATGKQSEVRPTFSVDGKPRYLRSLQVVARKDQPTMSTADAQPNPRPTPPALPERPQVVYAPRRGAKYHAMRMVWPLVCRRLEGFPNINAAQLFEELCILFPGRFCRWQYSRFLKRLNALRADARARGVVIGPRNQRRMSNKPRGYYRDIFKSHWPEMLQCLEAQPDQTALELLIEFRARYPEKYSLRNLSALQRRVRVWRREALQRLICELKDSTHDVATTTAAVP